MRVAFFIPVIAGRGGVESVVTNLLQEMRSGGDEPRLFIYSGSREKKWLEDLPWVREIGIPTQSRLMRLWTYFWQTLKEMRQWKPEAIVCTHPSTMRLARVCRWLVGANDVPIVLWLHGPLSSFTGSNKFLVQADGHICICEERAEEVRIALSQLKVKYVPPVCVAYNGTSIATRYSLGHADIPTFLYIGRLLAGDEKRVADILNAAVLLKGDFYIKIIGDGSEEEKQKLHEIVDQGGISEKVEWLGWQAEPWAVIRSATALVLASSYEGYSMVTVEALALGLPVICSEFGGIAREAIIPGKTGWMFPVRDVDRLAAIMQSIIDRTAPMPDPGELKQVGSMFSAENMAASFHSALVTMQAAK